jgi:Mg2+ and Co2+ transporter CorA
MRNFHIQNNQVTESSDLETLGHSGLPEQGFIWIACARNEFEALQQTIQDSLQVLCGIQIVDLHMSDLLNKQLPSRYDYTSQYDVLVFRRLAAGNKQSGSSVPDQPLESISPRGGPPILRRIDTSPVGFVLFERVLLTVHPIDCHERDAYAAKLMQTVSNELRLAGSRLPASPADLMLRVVNQMVDGFLELRRELTRQLDHWQTELLNPKTRFNNWGALMDARRSLHQLDEICEDQRSSIQDWIEALKTWPEAQTLAEQRERELLQVRSRDVLEHIERVVHHVRRLEQSTETAVQMHFSVQGSRTNDIMRTLTVLTAIFLPLNLVTGFFGMNFDALPLIHNQSGIWWALGFMVLVAMSLIVLFWRKRYLARTGH